MKLTESMNICDVSVRVSRTIKVNIKETSWETTLSCFFFLGGDALQSQSKTY